MEYDRFSQNNRHPPIGTSSRTIPLTDVPHPATTPGLPTPRQRFDFVTDYLRDPDYAHRDPYYTLPSSLAYYRHDQDLPPHPATDFQQFGMNSSNNIDNRMNSNYNYSRLYSDVKLETHAPCFYCNSLYHSSQSCTARLQSQYVGTFLDKIDYSGTNSNSATQIQYPENYLDQINIKNEPIDSYTPETGSASFNLDYATITPSSKQFERKPEVKNTKLSPSRTQYVQNVIEKTNWHKPFIVSLVDDKATLYLWIRIRSPFRHLEHRRSLPH